MTRTLHQPDNHQNNLRMIIIISLTEYVRTPYDDIIQFLKKVLFILLAYIFFFTLLFLFNICVLNSCKMQHVLH